MKVLNYSKKKCLVPNATSQKVCNKLTGTRFKKKKIMASIAKKKTGNGKRARIMI